MKVGALTQSVVRENVAPARGAAIARAARSTPLHVPGPCLLTLIPVGSLVLAGLLVAMLAWLARPTITPSVGSSLEEASDLGLPTIEEVECDGRVWRVGPTFTH
jgi:hypothetical protein